MKKAGKEEGTYPPRYPGIFQRVGKRGVTYELRYKAPDLATGTLKSRSETFKTLERARDRQLETQGQKASNTLVAASKRRWLCIWRPTWQPSGRPSGGPPSSANPG
jgi:hypothetical protein